MLLPFFRSYRCKLVAREMCASPRRNTKKTDAMSDAENKKTEARPQLINKLARNAEKITQQTCHRSVARALLL